jgi:hypothetical protein
VIGKAIESHRACDPCLGRNRASSFKGPFQNYIRSAVPCSFSGLFNDRLLSPTPLNGCENATFSDNSKNVLIPPASYNEDALDCFSDPAATWPERAPDRPFTMRGLLPASDYDTHLDHVVYEPVRIGRLTDHHTNADEVCGSEPHEAFEFLIHFTSASTDGLKSKFGTITAPQEKGTTVFDFPPCDVNEVLQIFNQSNSILDPLNQGAFGNSNPFGDTSSPDIWEFCTSYQSHGHFSAITNPQGQHMNLFDACSGFDGRGSVAMLSDGMANSNAGSQAQHGINHNLKQSEWFGDPLAIKTNEIVTSIKEVSVNRPRNSITTCDWSPFLEGMCVNFFCPPSLRKFLDLYWSNWYPNLPTIHKPTFDAFITPATLLASMALIGACVSPDASDRKNARVWFNSVEELAFGEDDLGTISKPQGTESGTESYVHRLRVLQAAYAVCLYQNWEGDDASKCRVRRHRYTSVVVVSSRSPRDLL